MKKQGTNTKRGNERGGKKPTKNTSNSSSQATRQIDHSKNKKHNQTTRTQEKQSESRDQIPQNDDGWQDQNRSKTRSKHESKMQEVQSSNCSDEFSNLKKCTNEPKTKHGLNPNAKSFKPCNDAADAECYNTSEVTNEQYSVTNTFSNNENTEHCKQVDLKGAVDTWNRNDSRSNTAARNNNTVAYHSSQNWSDRSFKSTRHNSQSRSTSHQARSGGSSQRNSPYSLFEREKCLSNSDFAKMEEIEQNLFAMDDSYALAHCVAADFNMGAGIAVTFREKFRSVAELLNQQQSKGGLAFLNINGRFIYYLVTKARSAWKPSYDDLIYSLEKMKKHIIQNDVRKLAIPQLGCGLDGLMWSDVKEIILYVFKGVNIKITVCSLKQSDEAVPTSRQPSRKSYVDRLTESITNVADWSIIIYLGSVDGKPDDVLQVLNSRFKVEADYRKGPREMGGLIGTIVEDYKYYLAGCIVKDESTGIISYTHFQECIWKLKKRNDEWYKSNCGYTQIAIPMYSSTTDDLLMAKLENLLKHTFNNQITITIYSGKV